MTKDARIYLVPMVESINAVAGYLAGLDRDAFLLVELIQDAAQRRLSIIDEAVMSLPPDFRSQCPDVRWRRIAGVE